MRGSLLIASSVCALLLGCGDSGDSDGDGKVSRNERAAEMQSDSFIAMKPGKWQTTFTFNDIDVSSLGKSRKNEIMQQVGKTASSTSCLTPEEAKNPGADFFGGAGAEKCVYTKFDISGQNAKMSLTCAMEGMGGSIDLDMKGGMGGDKFDFDTKVEMRLPVVGKVKLKGTAVGRHVGTCAAGG